MKTFKYIISTLALVAIVSLLFLVFDYKEKWETASVQHEELLQSQSETQKLLVSEQSKKKQFQDYSYLVKESYDKLLANYNHLQAQVETLKSKNDEAIAQQSKAIKDMVKQSKKQPVQNSSYNIDKVISLLGENKSQIEILKNQLASVQNSCSQPIVKIIERSVPRIPASVSAPKQKPSQKKPVDKFN